MTEIILRSLRVSLLCVFFGAPIAIGLGHLLARGRFAGRAFISSFVAIPLVLPPVVTGLLLLQLFSRNGPLASLSVPFSFTGAVIASFVVGLPLYVFAARAAFEAIDPRLVEVALSLGHTPRAAFRRVTLPLALPGVAAGAILMFARTLGEFGATIVLAGDVEHETRTIAVAVYALLESPSGADDVRLLAWFSIAIAFLALVGYELFTRWQRRQLEGASG